MQMIYIAAPYWHASEDVRNYRRKKAIEYGDLLFRKGVPFYSPLLFSERFSKNTAKERYWLDHGLKMVDVCEEMRVLCLEGWEDSEGVAGEIARAGKNGAEIKYIKKFNRVSFHGSRTITRKQAMPIIEDVIEKMQPDTIITHGEPGGACQHARQAAKEKGIPLKCHHLQHWRLAGQFHWRSTAVLEDSEHAIFFHDGISQGTANELRLAQKLKMAYDYYLLENDVLVKTATAEKKQEDTETNLLDDQFEKHLTQKVRQSSAYQKFRKAVLKRDKNKCVFCGETEKLCVHHVIPMQSGTGLAVDVLNGQTLCENCHRSVHGKKRA